MPDDLDCHFRCLQTSGGWEFQIEQIVWLHPSRPDSIWRTFRRWRTPPTPERLARARHAALRLPRFFRTCRLCREINATGHTINKNGPVCMSCAEQRLGLVF